VFEVKILANFGPKNSKIGQKTHLSKTSQIFFKNKIKMHSQKKKKLVHLQYFFGEIPSLLGYSVLPPQFVGTQQCFFQTKVIYL
jgi:hypothetical protein